MSELLGAELPGAELLGWLRARLRADRPLAVAAAVLLGTDALLAWLHVQHSLLRQADSGAHWLVADRLGLDDPAGAAVAWLIVQALTIAAAAMLAAVRRPSSAILMAAGVVVGLAALKLTKAHIVAGEALAVEMQLHGWLGLNGRQLGKPVVEIWLGLGSLAVAALAARLAVDGAGRTAAALAMWLLAGLALAGGLGDLGGMLLAGRASGAVATFALAESGGEMLVLSLGSLGFMALARMPSRRERPRRPWGRCWHARLGFAGRGSAVLDDNAAPASPAARISTRETAFS
jgi:hypothetical protein